MHHILRLQVLPVRLIYARALLTSSPPYARALLTSSPQSRHERRLANMLMRYISREYVDVLYIAKLRS